MTNNTETSSQLRTMRDDTCPKCGSSGATYVTQNSETGETRMRCSECHAIIRTI